MLIGPLNCLATIVQKYGSIQVDQLFVFDRSNPYQKQWLAKKIKQYQAIGFVFQKKRQDGLYAIRFVIKIPKQISAATKEFSNTLVARITQEGHTEHQGEIRATHSYSYLFSRWACETKEK